MQYEASAKPSPSVLPYEEFAERLDAWLRAYSSTRIKYFREGGKLVYDPIDGRRRRLGFAA